VRSELHPAENVPADVVGQSVSFETKLRLLTAQTGAAERTRAEATDLYLMLNPLMGTTGRRARGEVLAIDGRLHSEAGEVPGEVDGSRYRRRRASGPNPTSRG
jgi:hypothetical protein